jgi:hypothetical protein
MGGNGGGSGFPSSEDAAARRPVDWGAFFAFVTAFAGLQVVKRAGPRWSVRCCTLLHRTWRLLIGASRRAWRGLLAASAEP